MCQLQRRPGGEGEHREDRETEVIFRLSVSGHGRGMGTTFSILLTVHFTLLSCLCC
jgi:hypothetical protein